MRVIREATHAIAEGPVWDAATGTWLYVDILDDAVFRLDPADGAVTSFHVGQALSAVLPTYDGGLLLVGERSLLRCRADGSEVETFGEPLEDAPSLRLNDAKVDSRGRLWVGSRDADKRPLGRLLRVDRDAAVHVVLDGVAVSNGLGWSPDDRTFYWTDSGTRCVYAFDYDADSGALSRRRVFAQFPTEGPALPDGLTVDEQGHVWVAHFRSGRITRHDPGGALVAEQRLPTPLVASLAFGGRDGDELLVTTGTYRIDEWGRERYPLSGSIFHDRPGVHGVPTHLFGSP